MNSKNNRPASLRTLFTARRGIAIFMAVLILLSITILALSTMNRLSESSQVVGRTLAAKNLAVMSDAALRIALGEIAVQFIAAGGSPQTLYVNQNNTAAGQSVFKVLEDRRDSAHPLPLFAYRARADLMIVGDGSTTILPGTEIPASTRQSCYDIAVDVREMIRIGTGTNIQSDLGVYNTVDSVVYHFGRLKSVGVTTCFRKR